VWDFTFTSVKTIIVIAPVIVTMGVMTQEETDGDRPLELFCMECGSEFWTDETMLNDCPQCGHNSMTPA